MSNRKTRREFIIVTGAATAFVACSGGAQIGDPGGNDNAGDDRMGGDPTGGDLAGGDLAAGDTAGGDLAGGDTMFALDAPANLRIASTTSTSISLEWDYTDQGQTGFEVQRWVTDVSTSWETIATVANSDRTYVSGGLPASTQIGHRLRAIA